MKNSADFYADVGVRIKAARKRRGLVQRELAYRINIGQSALCYIERGRSRPSLRRTWQIAKALNVSIQELLP